DLLPTEPHLSLKSLPTLLSVTILLLALMFSFFLLLLIVQISAPGKYTAPRLHRLVRQCHRTEHDCDKPPSAVHRFRAYLRRNPSANNPCPPEIGRNEPDQWAEDREANRDVRN